MRTETITLFKFEELTKEVQNKLIQKEQNSDRVVFLESFKDSCFEQIEEAGFCSDDKIQLKYSLSYYQGDGLSFYAERFTGLLDIILTILGPGKEKTASILNEHCIFVMRNKNNRSSFASNSDIDYYLDCYRSYPNIENVVKKVLDHIVKLYINLCNKLQREGYEEIENQSSDAYIKDDLINMDYNYLVNGDIINI